MRYQGRITEWNDPRGFGFITPLEGGDHVFVHVLAFPLGSRRPTPGEFVNYSLSRDEKGRPRAERVSYVVSRLAREKMHGRSRAGVVTAGCVAVGVLIGISVAAWGRRLTPIVPAIYLFCSLGAYWHYGKDKAAARTRNRRTEEVALLTWGLFGGWPGALFAQHRFRHKVRKTDFQIAFWVSVVLNCVGLALLWS